MITGRVYRDHPVGLLERLAEVFRKFPLKFLGRERRPQLHGTIVDVIFRPQSKTDLHERQARVAIVLLREACKEFQDKSLEFGMRPIGESGWLLLTEGRGSPVILERLNVGRNAVGFADIRVMPAEHYLMLAGSNFIQHLFNGGPVILPFLAHDLAVGEIDVLQLDRRCFDCLVGRPEYDSGHRQNGRHPGFQGNGPQVVCAGSSSHLPR